MKTVIDEIRAREDLSLFLELLEKAELLGSLEIAHELTVFAPNNEAFSLAPQDILQDYYKIFYTTKQLATHHIVVGAMKYDDLLSKARQDIDTAAQTKLRITDTYSVVRVAGSKIVEQDIEVTTGILHVLDRLLLPPEKLQ